MALHLNFVPIMSVPLLLFISATKVQSGAFDVVAKFGAKADGKTDLSKALLDAWKEACASVTPSRIVLMQAESKVKLSNISFKNIHGTSALSKAIKIICSGAFPCQNMELVNIDIKHIGPELATSQCLNVKPKTSGKLISTPCSSPVSKTHSTKA